MPTHRPSHDRARCCLRLDRAGDQILAFTRSDLEAVDRSKTPWIIVTAHYPLYETYDNTSVDNLRRAHTEPDGGARGHGAAASPMAAAGEASKSDPGEADSADVNGLPTIVPSKAQAIADFEPLLAEFAVDIFFAGHDHNYETTWPVYKDKPTQRSYNDAEAPIHILSGTAGPPEWDLFKPQGAAWSREPRLLVNSYSRLTLFNSSVARFEQIANDNGSVVDQFTITQRRHNRSAPFACLRAS